MKTVTRHIRRVRNKEMGMWFIHAPSPRQLSRTSPLANWKSSCLLNPKKHAELFVTTIPKHIENSVNDSKGKSNKLAALSCIFLWKPKESNLTRSRQAGVTVYTTPGWERCIMDWSWLLRIFFDGHHEGGKPRYKTDSRDRTGANSKGKTPFPHPKHDPWQHLWRSFV